MIFSSIDQIRLDYPNQWVLVGSPELLEPEINASIISKLVGGVVLFASKDKRELAYKASEVRKGTEITVCVYTSDIPKNRLFLL